VSEPHPRERVAIVVEKAEFVDECLGMLADKQSLTLEEFRSDPEARDVVERRFEKATQACIDVARILL